jgi:hypothetical protein
MIIPVCIGCNKPANEIDEYIEAAKESEMSIEQYVREQEGTYNPENGHFACTDCYIKMGMPSKPAPNRWVAP